MTGPRLAAALAAALALALTACGGGSPSDETPTALRTPAAGPVIDLATSDAITTVLGADSGDLKSDLPSVTTGDFNSDGIDDLLIGARFGDGPDNTRTDAGEAYVVYGSDKPPTTVDIAKGDADVTIWGVGHGDNLGLFVHAGDVNGDGKTDIMVGAPYASGPTGTPQTGSAYVFFGGSKLASSIDLSEQQADLTLHGPGSLSFFGDSITSGDINDDGVNDIIIGATFAAPNADNPQQTGGVYAVYGSKDLAGSKDMTKGEYDLVVFGRDPQDELGDAVASADVNGDGVDDLLMVAEAADGPENDRSAAGEVYVVLGGANLKGPVDTGKDEQAMTVYGGDTNDILGFSIAGGDVDGDGVADIVVPARTGDGPGNQTPDAGQTYIIHGSTDLPKSIDLAQDQDIASFTGANTTDLLAAIALWDVNGDGNQEIIAGTGYGDGPDNSRVDCGEVVVLNAKGLAAPASSTSEGFRLQISYGPESEGRMGAGVAAGDFNGDGKIELIMVAPEANGPGEGRANAGRVYVVPGP